MSCLQNSQCKFKILYLPTADYVKWISTEGLPTVYPVDSIGYSYSRWVERTLVKGNGDYISYADWVLMNIVVSEKRKRPTCSLIKEHLAIIWE